MYNIIFIIHFNEYIFYFINYMLFCEPMSVFGRIRDTYIWDKIKVPLFEPQSVISRGQPWNLFKILALSYIFYSYYNLPFFSCSIDDVAGTSCESLRQRRHRLLIELINITQDTNIYRIFRKLETTFLWQSLVYICWLWAT